MQVRCACKCALGRIQEGEEDEEEIDAAAECLAITGTIREVYSYISVLFVPLSQVPWGR